MEERGEEGGNIRLCTLLCGNDLAHLGKLLLEYGNVALRPDVVGNESLLPQKIQSLLLLLLPPALCHTISPFLSFSLLGIGFDDKLSLLDSFWEAPWGSFGYCVPHSLPEWIVGGGRGSVFYSRYLGIDGVFKFVPELIVGGGRNGVFDLRYLGIDWVLFKVVRVFIAGRA